MTTRMRRLLWAAAGLAILLFLGRWTVTALADRWWGLHLSPDAGRFLTDVAILRGTLDLGGFLLAAAWTIGNLLVVYLAIGTVEVSRQIANLEVREALNPRTIRVLFIAGGLVLGLILGSDVGRHWPVVALAWQGAPFGVAEPILGHDAGLYVAQLPLWELLRREALVLVSVTILVVAGVYVAIGAIRRMDGRPAINDHARRHLGWLLAALAVVFAVGFLLEPFMVVAGARGPAGSRAFQLAEVTSLLLTGVAVMVALASLAWAFWAKHFFLAAGWMVLAGATLLARIVAGSLAVSPDVQLVDASTRAPFDAVAYGLANARDTVVVLRRTIGDRPHHPSLWGVDGVRRALGGRGTTLSAAGPAWLPVDGDMRPAWLLLATDSAGAASVVVLADDRTTITGAPLYYGRADTLAAPVPAPWAVLPVTAFTPASSALAVTLGGSGVEVASQWRRLALAWALQEGSLLRPVARDVRVSWIRTPTDRLQKLAPYAQWSNAHLRLDGGRTLWFVDGLVQARLFPLTTRAMLASNDVGTVRAGFLGVVDAESGMVRVFARPEGGPLADAWTSLGHGVVEPWAALPSGWRALAEYPREQFTVQALVLEAASVGRLVTSADSGRRRAVGHDFFWDEGSAVPVRVAPFVSGSPAQLTLLLLGRVEDGRLHLVRVGLDPLEGKESPAALVQLWDRFPTYAQLVDSVRAGGGSLHAGAVRFGLTGAGLVATQVHYGPRGGGGASVTWVSVAGGGRLGAGRSFPDAWSNLQGSTVPSPPGAPPAGVLAEARRWFQIADSTFRRGDFTAFGKAFEALRAVLDVPPD
jgi:hypothetical protein